MDEEKRDAYRISEEALLAVVPVPAGAAHAPVESHFQSSANVDAMARFAELDQGFRECQARLARVDAVAAEACDWLAAQIDLLRDAVITAPGADHDVRRIVVSISATGLGFEHDAELDPGTLLAVRLVLLPQHEPIVSYARVRQRRDRPRKQTHRAPEKPANGCFVGIEFVDLALEYQRRLNRHMLRAQISTRRPAGG